MSVLIKGMEMPKSCLYCRFHKSIYCTLTDICTNTAQGCPLIEIPPHGDLIDRDEQIERAWRLNLSTRELIEEMLKSAPTIIPSDKDGAE